MSEPVQVDEFGHVIAMQCVRCFSAGNEGVPASMVYSGHGICTSCAREIKKMEEEPGNRWLRWKFKLGNVDAFIEGGK